jgi:hypothetical protein
MLADAIDDPRHFGEVEYPVLNGHFPTLKMSDAEEVLLALKRDGTPVPLDEKPGRRGCDRSSASKTEL